MIITTKKAKGDIVFFLDGNEPIIKNGIITSITIEVGDKLPMSIDNKLPESNTVEIINIRYSIKYSNFMNTTKSENELYDSAEELLTTIKTNSGII